MSNYILVKLDEVSVLSKLLEHELTRIDDVPVLTSHLLDRVNAMIDAFIQATDPRDADVLMDFISEEFHDYRNMLDVVGEFIEACNKIRLKEYRRQSKQILSIRIIDLRSDVLIQLS